MLKERTESPIPKTRGEVEAALCDAITCFEQEYLGRGPKAIHAYLIDDLLVVRIQGVLTVAEEQLAASLPVEKGRDLLKQVRRQLIEAARASLDAIVHAVTDVKPRTLHYDISTRTGEEVFVFVLASMPLLREGVRRGHGRS